MRRTTSVPALRALLAASAALLVLGGLTAPASALPTLAVPAARFFRMRRSVSLLVAEGPDGVTGIVEGTYQSPILVQWQHAPRQSRVLNISLTELR